MSNEYNATDYHETVESIAREILQDCGPDQNRWEERIHEQVDSNSYIFMYAGPPVVKEVSDNWPCSDHEWQNVHALAGDCCDDDKLQQVAAYVAMEQDVREACASLSDDWETCAGCGNGFDSDDVEEGEECAVCGDWFCNDCLHEEVSRCKDCHEAEPEPDYDTDAFYTPCGPLGALTSASFYGIYLGRFESDDEALEAIRKAGNADNFFPNVWFIDDHGGYRLEKDFSWE